MFFILSSDQVKSSVFSKLSFWDRYGDLIIALSIIGLLVCFIIVGSVVALKKERKERRMIEIDGKRVDPELLVTVTMIGNTAETLTKGEIFTAPLIEKDGYDFSGWYYDTAFTKPYYNRPIKTDITLYPKWVKHS